ncbi:MAG: short-chain dehydrogenase [Bacteroidetes bacterium HGW-Bacteroidetes-9]|nr:MAG: short-chain dehydrogenase [Bacteroidetes bacterium HGW-Bacteroidetes-9]
MELNLKNRLFIVTGASSGFGEAIARQLIFEGASVIAVARNQEKLKKLSADCGSSLETMAQDVTGLDFPEKIIQKLKGRVPYGIVVNAGGPPSGGFFDVPGESWDKAYRDVFLWKAGFLKLMVPIMREAAGGRILMIESVSVKQPVEGLILSNTFRPAVVGMSKTLAAEVASEGITINILAPGYHETAAMQRLYERKSQNTGVSVEDAKNLFINESGAGKMGDPADFAMLAVWLLSPSSSYVNGQVISVAGNLVKGIFG